MVQQNIHGGDIYRNQVSLDFSVNINPFGMPLRVREALEAAVAWCERYPDIRSEALRDAIAGAKGIAPADIVCGNGASELFPAILRAVHAKKVLLPVPSFYGYEYAAKSVGAEICCHELLETDGYAVTERFLTAIGEDVDAVFLAVPNNPVGTVVEPELLEKIAERCKRHGVTLILDECFVMFTGAEERYSFLKKYRNYPGVVIVRAFTKLYAMPGVRLGYLVCSDAALTEAIRADLPEWNLSVFAQQAGCVACGQRAYVEHSVAFVCRERAWLTEQLSEIGITVFASNANFLMIKDGRLLAKELLKKGILIRDCSNYRGLSGGYYRIAVRRREENERLLAALAQVTGSSVVENGKEDKKPAAVPDGIEYVMPQEIEKRSFSIIEEELQLRGITLPVEEAMVTKRVIHTSADFSYAQTMTYSAGAVETAKRLITEGADIVTDTNMALSGINKRVLARYGGSVHCFMADEDVAREAKERGVTRATVSMERAAKIEKPVIFAIGNAPTALIQLYGMIEEGYRPAFIIGVPVGFVNVEAAKELILQTKIPHIVNRGRKGGSNVAAAICNAILYELGRRAHALWIYDGKLRRSGGKGGSLYASYRQRKARDYHHHAKRHPLPCQDGRDQSHGAFRALCCQKRWRR